MFGGLRYTVGGVRWPSHEGAKSPLEFIIGLMGGESWKYWKKGRDLIRLTFWKVIHILRAEARPAKGQFLPPHFELLAYVFLLHCVSIEHILGHWHC